MTTFTERRARRRVVVWHGESRSLFLVVEERGAPEDWEVLGSFESRRSAEEALGASEGELEAEGRRKLPGEA